MLTYALKLLSLFSSLGAAIFYNAFPNLHDEQTWEQRCACIATFLCCRQQIEKHPDGKRPPVKNIAELTAGLLSHIDMDSTDLAAAVILTSAAQQRRRRLRIAKALLPMYHAMQEIQASSSLPFEDSQDDEGEEEDEAVEIDPFNDEAVPTDHQLSRVLQEMGAASLRPQPSNLTTSNRANLKANFSHESDEDDEVTSAAIIDEIMSSERIYAAAAVEQLAGAIQEEIQQLGDSHLGEAALSVEQVCSSLWPLGDMHPSLSSLTSLYKTMQQDSLDLSNVRIDPDDPTIWFNPERQSAARDASDEIDTVASATTPIAAELETTSAFTNSISQGGDDPGGLHDAEVLRTELLERQITLRYPTVITPSEHVKEFAGPLSPEGLAEVYAGRHKHVPEQTLEEVSAFLRYAYAAYSLEPGIEAQSPLLNLAFFKPPDPQAIIIKSLGELGAIEMSEHVELLHLNCSNRVLAHLPYLVALDHKEQAVVIALRGTISVADLVTDAVVYPEVIDDWIPESIRKNMKESGPMLAHAGMVAAAQAVFEDMRERGIIPTAEGSLQRASVSPMGLTRERNADEVVRPATTISSQREFQGRQVGEIIKAKVDQDGYKLVVLGHSLGAGAAALLSLKLLSYFPRLSCLAYSCPGALVTKNLARAMATFCTTVVSHMHL